MALLQKECFLNPAKENGSSQSYLRITSGLLTLYDTTIQYADIRGGCFPVNNRISHNYSISVCQYDGINFMPQTQVQFLTVFLLGFSLTGLPLPCSPKLVHGW